MDFTDILLGHDIGYGNMKHSDLWSYVPVSDGGI